MCMYYRTITRNGELMRSDIIKKGDKIRET